MLGIIKYFLLKLQSENAQFGSKSGPWNLTDDRENNRAHLLCYFNRCASFRSHY